MGKMAIIIRDDEYDKVLTPLAFAYLGVAGYEEVDLLFVNWAARLMTEGGLKAARVGGNHVGTDEEVKAGVRAAGLPDDLHAIIRALKETGKVHFYLCSLAAQVFGVTKEAAIPELDDVVGAMWFLEEKGNPAETFMQF